MKSYFKYTNKEAFTLDGQDYAGFLHFSNGLPYTGKVDSPDMALLVPKNTFMANFYLNQRNFNTTFRNIEPVVPFFSNKNDLLNLQGLLNMLRHLNNNNLICFKNLIIGHPTVYQFEENSNFFYGLTGSDQRDLIGQRDIRNTIPFSDADEGILEGGRDWTFLDDVTTGSFTVGDDENFIYFCSTGNHLLRALKGNFNNPGPIEFVGEQPFFSPTAPGNPPDNIFDIYHDGDANQLFITFNDTVSIYDTTFFNNCQDLDHLLLVDVIPLGTKSSFNDAKIWDTTGIEFDLANFVWDEGSTIDNPNYPQYVKLGNNLRTTYNEGLLSCYNKYSNDLMLTLDLRTFNISALHSIDIRNTDDNIILLYRHIDNVLKLLYIDPEQLTFEDSFINSLKESEKFTVKFSPIDSDMFYVYNKTEYQTRFLSAPEWPCGRLEAGELHYPVGYKWGNSFFKWLSDKSKFKFGGTTSEANSFNSIVSAEIIRNNRMYMIQHNIGRIYALNQPPEDRFLNSLPLDTETKYSELACSETTLGLYFNASIYFIIRDILILFSKSFGSFNIRERSVIVQNLSDLSVITNDYYLNGNETFNVLAIQRILVLINDLQTALLSKSIEK